MEKTNTELLANLSSATMMIFSLWVLVYSLTAT